MIGFTDEPNNFALARNYYIVGSKSYHRPRRRRPSAGHDCPGRRPSCLGRRPFRGHAPDSAVVHWPAFLLLRGLMTLFQWPRWRRRRPVAVLEVEPSRPPLHFLQHRRRSVPPWRGPPLGRPDDGDGQAPIRAPAVSPVCRRRLISLILTSAGKKSS